MADPQDIQQGGSPVTDPASLAQILSVLRGGGAGAPPISTPTVPSQSPQGPQMPQASPTGRTDPFDIASIVSRVADLPQYQGPYQRLEDISRQEQGIQQQMAGMPVPQMGFKPSFEHGKFFHNLGQALLALGASTTPGQAIQGTIYGPDIREYQTKQKNLASQLEALKGQEQVPSEELRGLQGLAQAGGLAAYRGGMLDVRKQHEDTYAQSVSNRLQTALGNLDLNKLRLGEKTEVDKARTAIMGQRAAIAEEANKIREYGIDANNATRMAVANVVAQMGIDKSHPVAQMLDSILGTSVTPAAPQALGGAQPVAGDKPIPQRTKPAATPKAGGVKVGQQVTIKGKPMTVTAVHPDGSFDAK